jgi:hypothetical protein
MTPASKARAAKNPAADGPRGHDSAPIAPPESPGGGFFHAAFEFLIPPNTAR